MPNRQDKIKRIITETLEEHEKIWKDILFLDGNRSWPPINLKEQDIIVLSSALDRRFEELTPHKLDILDTFMGYSLSGLIDIISFAKMNGYK